MILTCPNCDAKFNIKDGALGTEGRKVKCSKCDHRWHALPDGSPAEAAPPPPPPPPEPEPALPPAGDNVEIDNSDPSEEAAPAEAAPDEAAPAEAQPGQGDDPFAVEPSAAAAANEDMVQVDPPQMPPESRFQPPEPKRSINAIIGWIIFILVIGAIVIGVTLFRKDLVKIYPPINKVFELIGVAPDTLGHGLTLPDPTSTPRREGNTNIIAVTGEIENTSKDTLDVPVLRGDLYDSQNQVTMTHFFKAGQDKILPGEKIKYTTEIKNPPAGSIRLVIAFTNEQPAK